MRACRCPSSTRGHMEVFCQELRFTLEFLSPVSPAIQSDIVLGLKVKKNKNPTNNVSLHGVNLFIYQARGV